MWPKRVFLAFLKFGPKSCISALFYCPKSYLYKTPGRVRAGPGFTFLSPGRAGPAFIFILLSPGRAGFKNVGQCRPLVDITNKTGIEILNIMIASDNLKL